MHNYSFKLWFCSGMLLNCPFPYFLNLRMDSLLMHLEIMQPNSLVKEKGMFSVNGLNTWYQISMYAMVYISYAYRYMFPLCSYQLFL